jgi:ribonuclease-3
MLQEELQKEGPQNIVYTVTIESGPAHARQFTVSVSLDGAVLGVGVGKSKKIAEQSAAQAALNHLKQLE